MSEWQTAYRPGNLGPKRDETHAQWNREYGIDKWRLAWKIGSVWVDLLGACCLYEDAYFAFFQKRQDILEQLLAEASDVYDDAESNVGSGLDYTKQETKLTHLQDIAIRRCVVRLGRCFAGTQLVQIRGKGKHPLSSMLSPSKVPFHRIDLIEQPQLEAWWQPNSVESFYQSNRYLLVHK